MGEPNNCLTDHLNELFAGQRIPVSTKLNALEGKIFVLDRLLNNTNELKKLIDSIDELFNVDAESDVDKEIDCIRIQFLDQNQFKLKLILR